MKRSNTIRLYCKGMQIDGMRGPAAFRVVDGTAAAKLARLSSTFKGFVKFMEWVEIVQPCLRNWWLTDFQQYRAMVVVFTLCSNYLQLGYSDV